MARKNRRDMIDESQVGIYHCTNRCVRRAFLCGYDSVAQRDRGHRREWLRGRLIWLAARFAIDVVSYSVMGNHIHLVLRNRPDLVEQLTDEQVIRAWWRISPQYRQKDGSPGELSDKRLAELLADADYLAERRRRLSSISWWMRYLTQSLALCANIEDDVTGRFWEGRFFSKPVDTLEKLFSSMVYVDLNPIRAGLALTPEESQYCSVHDRIQSWQVIRAASSKSPEQARGDLADQTQRDALHQLVDDWLSPIQLEEAPRSAEQAQGEAEPGSETRATACSTVAVSRPAARASDLGLLPISAEEYLQCVDWMGRIARDGQPGKIPADVPSILERLGLGSSEDWLQTYQAHAEQLDQIYRRPVNTDEEAQLSGLSIVNPRKTVRDALL